MVALVFVLVPSWVQCDGTLVERMRLLFPRVGGCHVEGIYAQLRDWRVMMEVFG